MLISAFAINGNCGASNGSFLRTGGGVSAAAEIEAHSFHPPESLSVPDAETDDQEPLARAEVSGTTNTEDTLANSYAATSALLLTPLTVSTFTPQVSVNSLHEDLASVEGSGDFDDFAFGGSNWELNGASVLADFIRLGRSDRELPRLSILSWNPRRGTHR
jgi:hypothetical protein